MKGHQRILFFIVLMTSPAWANEWTDGGSLWQTDSRLSLTDYQQIYTVSIGDYGRTVFAPGYSYSEAGDVNYRIPTSTTNSSNQAFMHRLNITRRGDLDVDSAKKADAHVIAYTTQDSSTNGHMRVELYRSTQISPIRTWDLNCSRPNTSVLKNFVRISENGAKIAALCGDWPTSHPKIWIIDSSQAIPIRELTILDTSIEPDMLQIDRTLSKLAFHSHQYFMIYDANSGQQLLKVWNGTVGLGAISGDGQTAAVSAQHSFLDPVTDTVISRREIFIYRLNQMQLPNPSSLPDPTFYYYPEDSNPNELDTEVHFALSYDGNTLVYDRREGDWSIIVDVIDLSSGTPIRAMRDLIPPQPGELPWNGGDAPTALKISNDGKTIAVGFWGTHSGPTLNVRTYRKNPATQSWGPYMNFLRNGTVWGLDLTDDGGLLAVAFGKNQNSSDSATQGGGTGLYNLNQDRIAYITGDPISGQTMTLHLTEAGSVLSAATLARVPSNTGLGPLFLRRNQVSNLGAATLDSLSGEFRLEIAIQPNSAGLSEFFQALFSSPRRLGSEAFGFRVIGQ